MAFELIFVVGFCFEDVLVVVILFDSGMEGTSFVLTRPLSCRGIASVLLDFLDAAASVAFELIFVVVVVWLWLCGWIEKM